MSQVTEFTLPQTEQDWKQKYSKLQNELLEARIEQINLRRINRSLQDTLKVAMSQDVKETQRNSTQRMNLTWKQKYEQQLQKNIENQKYIKVLQNKRTTLSSNKSNKKRQYSSNSNTNFRTETKQRTVPLATLQAQFNFNSRQMNRNSSVKKMEGFMDRLIKQKYTISDFGYDNYGQNYIKQVPKTKQVYYTQKDPIEKLFGSVKSIPKQNICHYTEHNDMPLKQRNSLNQNNLPHRKMNQKELENTLNKKLSLTSHFR